MYSFQYIFETLAINLEIEYDRGETLTYFYNLKQKIKKNNGEKKKKTIINYMLIFMTKRMNLLSILGIIVSNKLKEKIKEK